MQRACALGESGALAHWASPDPDAKVMQGSVCSLWFTAGQSGVPGHTRHTAAFLRRHSGTVWAFRSVWRGRARRWRRAGSTPRPGGAPHSPARAARPSLLCSGTRPQVKGVTRTINRHEGTSAAQPHPFFLPSSIWELILLDRRVLQV